MPKSCLPAFPLVVFGVVEPVLLPLRHQSLTPPPPLLPLRNLSSPSPLKPSPYSCSSPTYSCSWTPHPSVARGYLVAVALADYGHVWACYRGAGPDVFWDPAAWNDVLWGAVAGSLALNAVRWLALLGAFGAVQAPQAPGEAAGEKMKKKKLV
ncbi:uncharacterized protein F4812DRAFT_459877 [Daldinia caldariorum]|uniref:uncharacterized protein n=1 Tax=Daldinia caldariorum TaxID=326644 RepID=UPI0020085E1F|nr:uncharacterized protein F4812DRAFT_459877 [Daldinia caldariorum]KAI1467025.1 hypothetical protein F4812DRAFT_459877 [Daldinia caldariorum]